MILKGTVKYNDDGQCQVLIPRQSTCGDACAGCSGCSISAGAVVMEAKNSIGARDGERVMVEFPDRGPLILMALVFLVPLALLGLAFWGVSRFTSESIAGLSAVGTVAVYLVGLSLVGRKMGRFSAKAGLIVGIVGEDPHIT